MDNLEKNNPNTENQPDSNSAQNETSLEEQAILKEISRRQELSGEERGWWNKLDSMHQTLEDMKEEKLQV